MARQYITQCKDCGSPFYYSESSYRAEREAGHSRPERCPSCRRARQKEINNSGIGYYPVKLARDLPPGFVPQPGILGRVYHEVRTHRIEEIPSQLSRFEFGITDDDVRKLYDALESHQVAVVEGPTGSGKSTFLPYRLMVPPDGARDPKRFTRHGQIVVTQPRRLPSSSIAKFIAERLHGSGVGPGFDVGYKHSGSPETDRRNRLVFVTDGTLINWLVNEQIAHCSVIMIDEAHERSVNIDLILGLLRARLPRHPQLKVIIASATISAEGFIEYFGGSERVAHLRFKGLEKQVTEFFSPAPVLEYESLLKMSSRNIDEAICKAVTQKTMEVLRRILSGGAALRGDVLGFVHSENAANLIVEQLKKAIARDQTLAGADVYPLFRNQPDHVHTRVLETKAQAITNKIFNLASKSKPVFPMLAFLLDEKSIMATQESLHKAIGNSKTPIETVEIHVLHENQSSNEQHAALEAVRAGGRHVLLASYQAAEKLELQRSLFPTVVEDWRVIVATNVAETSLTVDGVVHVIDSGIIKQTTFDPQSRTQRLESKTHSQAGCRQRRGRAGRIRPGFAHYLYTQEQFNKFEPYTPPEAQRAPLDDLILAAKAAGLANPAEYEWLPLVEARKSDKPELRQALESELGNARESLKQHGALDAEGDITESGLDLRHMTLEPDVANLLMGADRFCCAIEMATLLPMVTQRLPLRGGLFLWNADWDAQTRWDARRRQSPLWLGCEDDVELVLKVVAAWEASGRTEKERAEWAKYFLVNHESIVNLILSERKNLLDKLSPGMRGESTRPLRMELLDRVRLVIAHSMPERVGHSSALMMSPDSVCLGRDLPLVTHLVRFPFKEVSTGVIQVRAGLIARLDTAWFGERKSLPLGTSEMARLVSDVTLAASGSLKASAASQHLALAHFPFSSVFECESVGVHEARVRKRLALPPMLLMRTGRRHGTGEEETGQLESVVARRGADDDRDPPGSSYSGDELKSDGADVSIDLITSASPAKLRLTCVDAPPDWRSVDLYIDGAKEVSGVSIESGRSSWIEVATGDHELNITPAGKPTTSDSASVTLRALEPGEGYEVFLGAWQGAHPRRLYVTPNRKAEKKIGRAALRWIHLGFAQPPEVWFGDKQVRPSGYESPSAGRPCKVGVYKQGGKKSGKPPLVESSFQLQSGQDYTLVVLRGVKDSAPPRLILLSDSDARVGRSVSVAAQTQWAAGVSVPAAKETTEASVVGYQLPIGEPPVVLFKPTGGKDAFDQCADRCSTGDSMEVEPVAVDEYPERKQVSLIVREPESGLEIAVPFEDLLFDSWGAPILLGELIAQKRLTLNVESIDRKRRRVYLSRLDKVASALDRLLDSDGVAELKVTVIEVVRHPKVSGVAVRIDLEEAGYSLGALVWEQGLRDCTNRELDSFAKGEDIRVRLKFTESKVKAGNVPFELIEKAMATHFGHDLKLRGSGEGRRLHLQRRMSLVERDELLALDSNSDYQWAIFELYRRSNQPRVDFVDEAYLKEIDRQFAAGTVIADCRVTAVREKAVEVQTPTGYSGFVPISEWANYQVVNLAEEVRLGDALTVLVVSRKDNGQLKLSRLRAAQMAVKVGERYFCRVTDVKTDRVVLKLESSESSNITVQLAGTVWARDLCADPPVERGKQSTPIFPKVGDSVVAKVTEVRLERGLIQLTIGKAFESELYLQPADAGRVGALIGTGGSRIREIKRANKCDILVSREADVSGGKRVQIFAGDGDSLEDGIRAILAVFPLASVVDGRR